MTYSPNFRGDAAKVGSRSLTSGYQNGAGMTLPALTPVSVNLSGQIVPVDLSNLDSVNRFVGLIEDALTSGAVGNVINGGRLEEITTSFTIGDALYVNKLGGLTSTKPEVGVENFLVGDYVIFVGVVVKNQFDPLKKDLNLLLSVVGQLG